MFEHVIRTPFDMKPVFKPCERPTFNANHTDIFIQAQKRIELDNLGKNIYFETPLAVEEQLVFKTAQKLGLALANSVAITRPKAIVLFGGLAQAGALLFVPTKKYMEKNLLHNYQDKIPLLASALPQSDAAMLGASALIWKTQL